MARSARRRSRARGARGSERANDARAEAGAGGNGAGDTAAPAGPRISRPTGAPRRRFGFFRRFTPRYVIDILSELRKVTWPSLDDTRYLTIVVSIVAIAVGIFLGGVDLLFGWVIEQVFFS